MRKSSSQYLIQLLQDKSKDMQDVRVDKIEFSVAGFIYAGFRAVEYVEVCSIIVSIFKTLCKGKYYPENIHRMQPL